jgi:hypothetical protein
MAHTREPKYRMYVDEVGNPDMSRCHQPAHRQLSLTGVILDLEYARTTAAPRLAALKQKYFARDADEPSVILHRKEMMYRQGEFGVLRDPAISASFDGDLLSLLEALDYVVLTAVIDKFEHREKYKVWRAQPPPERPTWSPAHDGVPRMATRRTWCPGGRAAGHGGIQSRGGCTKAVSGEL